MPARPRTGNDKDAAVPAKNVVVVVFDGVEAIDVAGPASVFSKAEQLHPGTYRLWFGSPGAQTVQTNAGLCIAGAQPLGQLPRNIDTLIVAGGEEQGVRAAIGELGVARWLAQAAPQARRVASVCTGAFALAAAGLLDGRSATTHWSTCELLQTLRPKVRVLHDRIYVRDGPVWTSAGVTTGIELALALVEDDLGKATAMDIARTLALPLLRGAEQPQLSPTLQAQSEVGHRLRELLAWIPTHLRDDLSVRALAQRAHMSDRHFARAFAAETGSTPALYVLKARVAAACDLLRRTNWPQQKVADRSGFGSVDAMQRAFERERGMTPGAYRG